MDYAKSGGQEIGTVIEHREWVEGTEIGYWRSDIGVGAGSNKCPGIMETHHSDYQDDHT